MRLVIVNYAFDARIASPDALLDAYHSLSIEGYQVTPELVQRAAMGAWDPDGEAGDRETANALAARGYWLAFQRVREVVRRVLTTSGDIGILRSAHRDSNQPDNRGANVGLRPARAIEG